MSTEKCQRPNCDGSIEAGYCDECGRPPVGASGLDKLKPSVAAVPAAPRATQASTVATVGTGATSSSTGSRSTSRSAMSGGASRSSASRRLGLGGGLYTITPQPKTDPLSLLMNPPEVPEAKRFCPNPVHEFEDKTMPANTPVKVGRSEPQAKGQPPIPGRTKGFCGVCNRQYDFRPKLIDSARLDQFEVPGPIAYGGFGWVYLARDIDLDRWVVLKGLLNSEDQTAAAAAIAERKFLSAVKHPKIVQIHQFIQKGTESYIVMEYVGGRTLKDIRKERGPLPAAEAIAYILGILPAFSYLHRQGMVYCDFKPDNIMLEGDDVKLIDLGGVRMLDTASGPVYSTPGYRAPEGDRDPSIVSDTYTIGRTLLVLIQDFELQSSRYSKTIPAAREVYRSLKTLVRDSGVSVTKEVRVTYELRSEDGSPAPAWLKLNQETLVISGTAPEGVYDMKLVLKATEAGKTPVDIPVELVFPLSRFPALDHFLRRACHAEPDARFQSADEMADQLWGVLRSIVATDSDPKPADSTLFISHPICDAGAEGDIVVHMPAASKRAARLSSSTPWAKPAQPHRLLPTIKIHPDDPAAQKILALAGVNDPTVRERELRRLVETVKGSVEARLRHAEALTDLTRFDEAAQILDAIDQEDAWDWRSWWTRGRVLLAGGKAPEAIAQFDRVWYEVPGELAPQLAIAIASEAAGDFQKAIAFNLDVLRTDPAWTGAAFSLARCFIATGKWNDASGAYARIPMSSLQRQRGAMARAAALLTIARESKDADAAVAAGNALDPLLSEGIEGLAFLGLKAEILTSLVSSAEKGGLNGTTHLLGTETTGEKIRLAAETSYLASSRFARSDAERIALIDAANAIRPATFV